MAAAKSTNSVEVSYTPPIPPPPPPRIGWFDYEGNDPIPASLPCSTLSAERYYIANNDLLMAIDPTTTGVGTYYIVTNGHAAGFSRSQFDERNHSAVPYQDGLDRRIFAPLHR